MSNLFIALGGTGYKVVSKVQKSNQLYYAAIEGSDPNSYLYIDTDQISIDGIKNNDPNTKILNLGSFKPADHYVGSKKADINKWFDGESITMPDKTLKEGAKAIRQLSRMAFYYEPQFIATIVNLLKKFKTDNQAALDNNQRNLDALKIYVVTGSAGGTGSGIFIDLLYTMWRYYIDEGDNGNLDVKALILMPNLFLGVSDEKLKDKYRLNGFAFLQELNALVRQGCNTGLNDQFFNYLTGQYNTIPEHSWQPIKAGILIDDTNKHFDFTNENLYEIISEFLFAFTIGSEIHGTEQLGDNNNNVVSVDEALNSALTNSDPDRNLQYINFFSSFGILVLKSANEYFSKYVKNQLYLDILQSITGEETYKNIAGEGINEWDVNIDLNEVTKKINEKFVDFENERLNNLVEPKLNKGEKDHLKNLLDKIDFVKSSPKAEGPALTAFIQQIEEIRDELKVQCELLKTELFNLHKTWLGEGKSLTKIIEVYKTIDQYYYDSYIEESNLVIDPKKPLNAKAVIISKAKKYFYYMLSKGEPTDNAKGYMDLVIAHLTSIKKEIKALIPGTLAKHDDLIKTLNSYLKNGTTRFIPDVSEIVITNNNISKIDPDSKFCLWYKSLNIDIQSIHASLLVDLYATKQYDLNQGFILSKFKGAIVDQIENKIKDVLIDNDEYQLRMSKSILDLINEIGDKYSFDYIKNFDYPYIKLTESEIPSKRAYVGDFQGQTAIAEMLGYVHHNINEIRLDDPFYKDRIVKIVFHHKISFDKYFRFKELKETFGRLYTQAKLENKIVPSPFLHKDLAGSGFEADIYKLLNSASKTSEKKLFDTFSDETKKLLIKFGLVYLYKFINKGKETDGFFKPTFDANCIKFNSTSKVISLSSINYRALLKMYSVDLLSNTDIDCNAGANINMQAIKSSIMNMIQYLNSSRSLKLSDENDFQIFIEASEVCNYGENFDQILISFIDIEQNRTKRSFMDYFETILI